MASLELPFGIKVLNPTPVDAKYLNDGVPYTDVSEVNAAIGAGIRHTGLTVNIGGVEYWYATGIGDGDLVIKTAGGAGSGERIEKEYTQASHGFAVGEVVAWSGSSFIKALADGSQDAEVVGFVTEVADVNNFTIVFSGYIEGISGLTLSGNTTYFVSTTVAGGLQAVQPSEQNEISKPILTTFTSDDALVFQYREFVISSGTTDSDLKQVFVTTASDIIIPETSTNALYASSGTTGYTLTATPIEGSEITIVDELGTAGTNNILIDGNGKNIYDNTSFNVAINTDYGSITMIYNGFKWNITAYVA